MKKILLTMLGVAGMLCSTSCSDDSIVKDVEGDQTVQFTVELADGSDASRATISDGTTVSELYYEVYTNVNGEKELTAIDAKTEIKGKQATVSLALVKGQTYDIVFWAQAPGAYDASNLCSISIPGTTANNEEKDAFTAVKSLTVNGPIKETIKLTRPFAQVNFGTPWADVAAAEAAGADIQGATSMIKVSRAASKYNALTEVASEETEYLFAAAPVRPMGGTAEAPSGFEKDEELVVGDNHYEYLATAYVLVPTGDAQVLADLEMTITTGLNKEIVLSVPNAPVKRNYRTNVLGNLLTNQAEFTVIVDQDYEDDYPNTKEQELRFAAATGGAVTLTEDITLTAPLQVLADFVLDLNGKTLTGNFGKEVGAVIKVENNKVLKISNGTVSSTATNGGSALENKGITTIDNVTINGAPSDLANGTAAYAVRSNGAVSKLVVNNSNILGRGAIAAENGAKVEINGGTYHTPEVAWGHAVYAVGEGTEVVINNGTFSEGYEMSGDNWGMYQIYAGSKAKVIVNGGTFMPWDCANGFDLCTATEGVIEIYGGAFAEDPSNQNNKNYVAEGYKSIANNGLYYVVADEIDVIAEDGATLLDALQNGKNVLLSKDIVLSETSSLNNVEFILDGNGYTIKQDPNCVNTYALLDITGGKAVIKNVTFDGIKDGAVVRTVNAELDVDNVTVENCEITQTQGLLRLLGKSTIKNSTFENNTCNMLISLNYDGANNDPQVVSNCVIKNNICNDVAAVYYVKGASATIDGNEFIENKVKASASNGNGATLYMGFQENCTITNNLFENNAVTTTTASKRVAGALMIGYAATITGNAFVGNTATAEDGHVLGNDVCASVYYADIDLSGNYWGGNAPVENDDYFVEYPDNNKVIINDYLTAWSK